MDEETGDTHDGFDGGTGGYKCEWKNFVGVVCRRPEKNGWKRWVVT